MADDVQLNAGAGGDVAAADDIGGIKFQRIKLVFGSDGTNDGDASYFNPYPVRLATQTASFIFATITTAPSQQISGSVIATLSGENFIYATPTGSQQVSGSVAVTLSGINFIIASPTGSQQISGSVTATLSGSNFVFATQSGSYGISGNVGATQSGAWAVGVTGGNIAATQSGAWNVGVSGSVAATLSGTNFIVATVNNSVTASLTSIATNTNAIGGIYIISRRFMDEAGRIQAASDSFVDTSSSGDTSVVGTQGAGVRIRVFAAYAHTAGAQTLTFRSGTTAISAGFPVFDRTGFVLPYNPHGWFQTAQNAALNINLSSATTTGVQVSWGTTT